MDEENLDNFKLIQQSYEQIWTSPQAHDIDFGTKDHLDKFYKDALKTADFIELLKKPEKLTVIDLGSGRGSRLARVLYKKGAKIIAVDCFPAFKSFRLRYKAEKVIANATDTGLPAESADIVISSYTTLSNPYFESQEIKEKYIQEIIRLLKPGGIFWGEEKDLSPNLFLNYNEITHYGYQEHFFVHFFKKKDSSIELI